MFSFDDVIMCLLFLDIVSVGIGSGESLAEGLEWLRGTIAQRKSSDDAENIMETGAEKLTGNYGPAMINYFKHIWSPAEKSTC